MKNISPDYEKTLTDFKKKRSARLRRQVNNVMKLIGLSRNETILEVGVATGKFSSLMSKDNSVYAADIMFENLKRAQRAVEELGNKDDFFCIQANCATLPVRDARFDKVLAIDVIEHLSDDIFVSFCREAHRVLKRNGCFYIYTPNLLHPFELARPFRPVLRREHIGVRRRATICRCLQENKFIIKRSYFNNFFRRISIKAQKIST